ncbi:hypothetical protein M1394_01440 [Candidatus Marsarchaeota archaeon]|nr:hypothetical protein [Candidatus Marsarchaeota archaeon]
MHTEVDEVNIGRRYVALVLCILFITSTFATGFWGAWGNWLFVAGDLGTAFFCLILILYVISRWKDVSDKALETQRRSLFILMGLVFVSQFFNLAISAGKPLFLNAVYVIFGIVMVILNLLVGGEKRSPKSRYLPDSAKKRLFLFLLFILLLGDITALNRDVGTARISIQINEATIAILAFASIMLSFMWGNNKKGIRKRDMLILIALIAMLFVYFFDIFIEKNGASSGTVADIIIVALLICNVFV